MTAFVPPPSAMVVHALQDFLQIDPVQMNIVNRLAFESSVQGDVSYQGGLLLQGRLIGSGSIDGTLIIWHQAQLQGKFWVNGDVYLFGDLGQALRPVDDTIVQCAGTAYFAQSAQSFGTVLCDGIKLYDGAKIIGPIKTLQVTGTVPA